ARRCVAGFAAPLVGLMAVVQSQVVVDGFGGQHGGEVVGQRLHAVERAVAADANEPFDVQTPQPLHDFADGPRILGVNVIARAADDRAAASHLQLGDGGEQGVQADVRYARVEQTTEALDEAKHFDFALIGPYHSAVDGRVEGRRIAARGQDADAFHALHWPRGPRALDLRRWPENAYFGEHFLCHTRTDFGILRSEI